VKVDGQDYWARLQGFCIKIWESKKHAEEGQNPEHMIPVNKVSWQLSIDLLHNCFIIFFNIFSYYLQRTIIQLSKTSGKELLINNSGNSIEKLLSIKFESKEEAQKWLKFLSMHVNDHSRWKHAAEVIQRVSNIESTRNSFISNKRQGSLYDETPLIGKCTRIIVLKFLNFNNKMNLKSTSKVNCLLITISSLQNQFRITH